MNIHLDVNLLLIYKINIILYKISICTTELYIFRFHNLSCVFFHKQNLSIQRIQNHYAIFFSIIVCRVGGRYPLTQGFESVAMETEQ